MTSKKQIKTSLIKMDSELKKLQAELIKFQKENENKKIKIIRETFQQNVEFEKEYRNKCIDKICSWVQVENETMLPNRFLNKLDMWLCKDFNSFAIIYETMELIEPKVNDIVTSRKFESLDHKCNYIGKMIENDLKNGKTLFFNDD